MAADKSPPTPDLHPIAEVAAGHFEQGAGKFSDKALADLTKRIEALHQSPDLVLAVNALVQVAGHIDNNLGNKPEATKLLKIAVAATPALEALNRQAKAAESDARRARKQAFQGFTGTAQKTAAPVFGSAKPAGAQKAHSFQIPKKIK